MKTIWKFNLNLVEQQKIKAPFCRALHVGLDPSGYLCLWAKVDTSKENEEIDIRIFGTGHPMPESDENYHYEYIGSVVAGGFLWHVFECFDMNEIEG